MHIFFFVKFVFIDSSSKNKINENIKTFAYTYITDFKSNAIEIYKKDISKRCLFYEKLLIWTCNLSIIPTWF